MQSKSNEQLVLGIESSCDETAAAVIGYNQLNGSNLPVFSVRSNIVATQQIHASYGGVVPELASRAHQENIVPVVQQAIHQANIAKTDLDLISFTRGPGLMGALLVGSSFAKSLAYSLNIPLIGVHHMKAHVMAHFISAPQPTFPFLCLTVSGGHTQIVRVNSPVNMKILGQTQDDAVGEAFDKAAKIINLPYPGGPLVDRYAQSGDASAFSFPVTGMPGLDFSFSGIKTAFLYFIQRQEKQHKNFVAENLHDICASIQYTLVKMLMDKLQHAVNETGIQQVAIAGGVSANSLLRASMLEKIRTDNWEVYIPEFEYTTDNAAMIAVAGALFHENGERSSLATSSAARLTW